MGKDIEDMSLQEYAEFLQEAILSGASQSNIIEFIIKWDRK